MKVERWEEESDEDWAERLAEEIEIANNTKTAQYYIHLDPDEEDGIIINYIGESGWTWKEHPEGPFKAGQIIDWKNKVETLSIYEKQFRNMTEHALELEDKLEAVKNHIESLRKIDFYDPPFVTEWDEWWKDYRKILDDSEFTTNSEESE